MPDETRTAQAAPVPAVVAPPPGNPRFPHVDALRAVAALSVLVYHCGNATGASQSDHVIGPYLSRGDVGVTLFFVISGFLLYRPFVAARLLGAPPVRLVDYARRRLLRIVPAYWLALTVLAIYPGLDGVFTHRWWVYYGFAQAYSASTLLTGIGAAWTLCVEMSFYAVLPIYAALVAFGLRRVTVRRQVTVELAGLVLISAASVALRAHLYAHSPLSWALYSLPCHLDWFAAGMILATLSVAEQRRAVRSRVVGVIARAPWLPWLGAAIAFWAAARLIGGPHDRLVFGEPGLLFTAGEDAGLHVLYVAVAIGLVVPAVFGNDGGGWVRAVLRWRPFALLGLISYGVYLWQEPVFQHACQPRGTGFITTCRFHDIGFARHAALPTLIVVTFVVSVACAAASYVIVERPALRLKNGLRAARARRVAA